MQCVFSSIWLQLDFSFLSLWVSSVCDWLSPFPLSWGLCRSLCTVFSLPGGLWLTMQIPTWRTAAGGSFSVLPGPAQPGCSWWNGGCSVSRNHLGSGCSKVKEAGQIEVPTQGVPDPPDSYLFPLDRKCLNSDHEGWSRRLSHAFVLELVPASHLSASTLAVSHYLSIHLYMFTLLYRESAVISFMRTFSALCAVAGWDGMMFFVFNLDTLE